MWPKHICKPLKTTMEWLNDIYDQNLKCIIVYYYIGLLQCQNTCILGISSELNSMAIVQLPFHKIPNKKTGTSLSMILILHDLNAYTKLAWSNPQLAILPAIRLNTAFMPRQNTLAINKTHMKHLCFFICLNLP